MTVPARTRRTPRRAAFTVVARRHLNPDAFPAELADAAAEAGPQVATIACDTFDAAVAAGRMVQRGRSFGFHIIVEIVAATGGVVAHVSSNGRVWQGAAADWRPGTPEWGAR